MSVIALLLYLKTGIGKKSGLQQRFNLSKARMTEIDLETRIELLLANYAGMIQHLAELERKMNNFEDWMKQWRNS